MSHFYDPKTLKLMDKVECKSRPGEYRDSTITDARKNGWCPSVTEITKCWEREDLQAYKRKQILKFAFDNNPSSFTSREEWEKRINELAQNDSIVAAEYGTQLHYNISRFINKETSNLPDHVKTFLSESVIHGETEKIMVNEFYGGTIDFVGKTIWGDLTIVDWKTQTTKQDQPFKFYKEWCWQLAAYKVLVEKNKPLTESLPITLVNVAISSTEEKRVEAKVWDNNEVFTANEVFINLMLAWRKIKGL